MSPAYDQIRAIRWQDDALRLLDQRRLPGHLEYLRLDTVAAVARAISEP